MNQQPLWFGQQQSQHPQKMPHLYRWQTLTALFILYIIPCILFGITNAVTGNTNLSNAPAVFQILTSIGVILLLLLHVVIIAIDANNFFTLNGKIQWRSLNRSMRVVLGFIYMAFWIMPAIYLVVSLKYLWDVKRERKAPITPSNLGQSRNHQTHSSFQGISTSQSMYIPTKVPTSNKNEVIPMGLSSRQRTKVFISYSHKDEKYLQRLHTHFAHYERMGIVEVWDDTKLAPGALWQEEIQKLISQTKVALLLVSADYLASQFIVENELPPLLHAAQTEGATIIPVILSACAFEASELAQFQALNSPTKPLSSMSWDEKEKIWATVAKVVSNAIHSHQPLSVANKTATPFIERNKGFEQESPRAQQLVLERPYGWEYLLTAELLYTKLIPIQQRLSNIKSGSVYQKSTPMQGEYFFNWAQAKFNDYVSLLTFASNILNRDMPASWGPLGAPGDSVAIKQSVEKLIYVCDELLKREVEIHFISVPNQLAKLKHTMEDWSTDFIYQIGGIPAQLAAPFAQPNAQGIVKIHLVFREPASIKAFRSELRKIEAKVKRHGKRILFS